MAVTLLLQGLLWGLGGDEGPVIEWRASRIPLDDWEKNELELLVAREIMSEDDRGKEMVSGSVDEGDGADELHDSVGAPVLWCGVEKASLGLVELVQDEKEELDICKPC